MGLFGDKLLLRLHATEISKGKQRLQIVKLEKRVRHLLPFSCASLIGSQLVTLTSFRPETLSKDVLGFIDKAEIQYSSTLSMKRFELEIYKKKNSVYNQFNPQFSYSAAHLNNDLLENDVVNVLINYITTVYENSNKRHRSRLRASLLLTIVFYQQEITPIIKRINLNNIEQRTRLLKTMMDFSSALYNSWESPTIIKPSSSSFLERIDEAKSFDAYAI